MKYLLNVLVLFALAGGTVFGSDQDNARAIEIEKQSSVIAGIGPVSLTQLDSSIEVHGTVRKAPLRRGPIDGSIRIEVVGAGNEILQVVDTGYRRSGASSRYARFHVILDVDPAQVTAVRISHQAG